MYLPTVNSSNNSDSLDSIRKIKGINAFQVGFHELGKNKKSQAVKLINDNGLSFTSLFLLMPEIEALNLYPYLNARNTIALNMCGKVLKNKKLETNANSVISQNANQTYPVLKWMLNTGYTDDGLNDDFDEILDCVVAVLIKEYEDKNILPVVADMIFDRNKKGTYNHDLVWSFFQVHDLNSLKLIAQFLESPNENDVDLACKLLHYKTFKKNTHSNNNSEHHKAYLEWLEDNYDFLYFTGESFQQTSNPQVCDVDVDAKYLGKSISPHNRKMSTPLTQSEKEHLEQFHKMDNAQQINLSNFAHKVQKNDLRLWSKWNNYPVSKQVDIAQSGLGGIKWL